MTAFSTLPHSPVVSQISKHGVLVLHGFGIKIRMRSGHLEIEDGVGLERRKIRLARVNHRLKRLVCISDDGYVSLSALTWLSDVGASFILLDRRGKIRLTTGPIASSDSKLRRAQAFAMSNGVGLVISRALIIAKLEGQERLVRERLNDSATAQVIASFRERLHGADTFYAIRNLESLGANAYFTSLRNVPVLWPKADLRKIPSHWRTVGARQSPLSGGPRLAVTPVHAMVNYCAALLESETRLALSALGLLPDLGLGLHTDTHNRDSLVFDVCEPVRPQMENWLLSWITREPLRRNDYFETPTGNCRLTSHLCARVSETAPTWGKLVAPWAEYVAQTLWSSMKPKHGNNSVLPTRLTQQRRTEAKGKVWTPSVKFSKPEHLCDGCGTIIATGRELCAKCAVRPATERLVNAARIGRVVAHTPESRAKQSATRRRHTQACSEWDASKQPAWLTEKFYSEKVQPLLAQMSASVIARQISVSRWYAGKIRQGYRPHPRHWQALAKLVGVEDRRIRYRERRLLFVNVT